MIEIEEERKNILSIRSAWAQYDFFVMQLIAKGLILNLFILILTYVL
jgi:hypothetical protein